ncbi:hypothetical protein GCM10007415_25350 [Parapedobacter pyrenivorans]|uniref:Uncharacterized protein n=1 Tax=Parapedobacter pyrenivorans TaxID=1305674 RepID=A0A917HUQ0_9SPHI|nr:hypothetical protein [Parapedobacter pyrenivorans]GGG89957.1 hypothetical protein GCM10007415_25350 [Parapedobacter pyrenivorans]
MAQLTLLSTYVIKLKEKRKSDYLFLSRYNESKEDFLDLFRSFLQYRKNNHYSKLDKQGIKKTLLFKETFSRDVDNRTLQGFLHSGLSGQRGQVVDDSTGDDLYVMEKNHAKILPTYFFMHVPENRRFGYLILQRKSNYGIKELLVDSFNDFLIKLGAPLLFEANNFLVSSVFEKMLSVGRVFEMSFIKNHIPDDIEDMYDKDSLNKKIPGKIKTIVTTKNGFPVKGLLKRLYFAEHKHGMVEIPQLNDRFDEVDFEMEYNGSKKTFHMKNVGKTTPDFNVTDQIEFIDDMPTYASLESQCHILLKDMRDYHESKIR